MTEGNLLNAKQVAARLALSERMITKMATEGNIPAIRVGSQWRFDPVDIQAYIDANRMQPKLPPSDA